MFYSTFLTSSHFIKFLPFYVGLCVMVMVMLGGISKQAISDGFLIMKRIEIVEKNYGLTRRPLSIKTNVFSTSYAWMAELNTAILLESRFNSLLLKNAFIAWRSANPKINAPWNCTSGALSCAILGEFHWLLSQGLCALVHFFQQEYEFLHHQWLATNLYCVLQDHGTTAPNMNNSNLSAWAQQQSAQF